MKLFTVDDVAVILRVSRKTAYKKMHEMRHMEHPFRVEESVFMAFIAANTICPMKKPQLKNAARYGLTEDGHIKRRA